MGPHYCMISTNLDWIPPPPVNASMKAFYFKTWSENEGLLEVLSQQGIVRALPDGVVTVNQWGSKAVLCELLLHGDEVSCGPHPKLEEAFGKQDCSSVPAERGTRSKFSFKF
ncbi:hypothetical protein DUNSADRAFT_3861 [Dunaliella salina]|uniref:Uncharacterized protein n=1 Tax=Dunaliella salina TaxID=3046 RepID=A0ABQ7GT65_DUNSA|nr:hypothetical protein DUNSADRAFT_3861 [Dunaliella salina]|eukprot:KAF5837789.1 hypothetical protein DUNSADRAFT_3861 [Dunaliella salina]